MHVAALHPCSLPRPPPRASHADATNNTTFPAIQAAYTTANVDAGWVPGETPVMLGLMAGDVRMGVRALRDWCQGLGLPYLLPESRVRS